FKIDYDTETSFLGIEGTRVGLDDQAYQIDGRNYGKFKYSLFYNEIPHNLSFGAQTFYSSIGSDNLTIDTSSPSNQASWRTFDYQVDTQKYGGTIDLSFDSPFFLHVGVDRVEKDGLKPLGSGSFSGVVEMPEPVDYATNNFNLTGGYRSEDLAVKVSGLYSSFSNDNPYLDWQNPFLGITEHNSLPPDNDYLELGVNLMWRQLPGMSTLTVNGSYSNLTSDFSQDQEGGLVPAGLNTTVFEGDIATMSLAAIFASRFTDDLDTRIFYKYFDRENDSTIIEYDDGGNRTHLLEYSKHNLGFDADYKLARDTRLGAGYEYENVERRNRPDGDSTSDNLLYLEVKNTSLDYLTARLKYSYLNRDTDADHDLTGVSVFDSEYIVQFVQRYDVASKQKHALQLALELYPMDSLDFGLSYTLSDNNYDDVTLGRTDDIGHEFYVDFMWRAAGKLNLSGFAGYENYQADSNHYNYAPGQFADPRISDSNPATYRWTQDVGEDFWTVGVKAQVPIIPERLELSLSCQYQKSEGESDFTSEGTSTLLPITKYDDYDITTVSAKIDYTLTDRLGLGVGYLYEKSTYEDLQYLEYDYNPGGTYLSGAYADHDYEAHVGYVTLKYRF
ncbi:MAG: MtrB/PioB family outer membrane beta-barrel protein, partial [Desulfofustis sp.]|nr:MtrB/PioB family outer membrane beta-barrel protein [Desulfofustis sp.]